MPSCHRLWVIVLGLLGASVTLADSVPENLLLLGPLNRAAVASGTPARAAAFVPELQPPDLWPAAGDPVAWAPGNRVEWTAVATERDTARLPKAEGPAVSWLMLYGTADRFGQWTAYIDGPGEIRLWVDGQPQGTAGDVAAESSSLEATLDLHRGMHRFALRIESDDGSAASVGIRFASEVQGQALRLSVDPTHAVASYDEWREVTAPGSLLLSPDGDLLVYRLRRRDASGEGSWQSMNVVGTTGQRQVASGLGGPGATPLAWRADSRALLFRDGESLFVWDVKTGFVRRVLSDEPGLGAAAWSPDGTFVVFASTRGVDEPAEGPRRRVELREKLTDWPTAPHLHLLMLESGARRRLTDPGDWVQDAFAVLPDNRTLIFLRNLPMDERPWFYTNFQRLDLLTGDNAPIGKLVMGFENRPGLSGFDLSPDGTKVAFVAPPSELGSHASTEHNAFDPDLFVMHLDSGEWYRLTERFDPSVAGAVTWAADSRSVRFQATDGSRSRIARITLRDAERPFAADVTDAGGERIDALALSGAGAFAAVVSDTDRLPVLVAGGPDRAPRQLLDPQAALRRRWSLAGPVDASYTGPDGSRIEGWLYRPAATGEASDAPLPLVVYYYGGATPTLRGFNELHQFIVGNGYALFVMNPRGANGYGEAFADQHVAEQGQLASADILAGVDAVLAANPDLDPQRVGCFGGSYGGFMTMTLITKSDRFAAAVSLYGISNVASYFGDGMWGYTYGDQAINRYPWSDPQFFVERSPLFAADRVHTPLLLLHGDEDGNVPPGESEQMFTALRLLDRPVELVRFPGEDHGLRGTWANRVAHRTMLIEWFDRWLRDRPEAWNARWAPPAP